MFDLSGSTALVTGASQGIGAGIARALAAHGAKVVLAARSGDKLARLEEKIRQDGGEASAFELDVADPEAVAERLKQLPEGFTEVDILVNNAGITDDNLLARMSVEQWERVLATNLTGTYAVTKALCRGMMKRRRGRVIIVSSVVGLMGNAGQTNYAAAKAGLIGFAKSLARELASRHVTVNVVAPGFVTTDMTAELAENSRAELERSIPLERLGTVEDIAAAVVYLASEEAGYVTGHVLNVSGGMYI
ncbi:MAG: 3-oxoacyl-[acyl-carrier-protein] reductase [Thermoanaerobaculia bacterium]|nr:3-oxoacyl-[acyl-carrier-protein] reductase [Thermoanaerobaculia bacterium]